MSSITGTPKRWAYNLAYESALAVFGKPRMQGVVSRMMRLLLRARGYQNEYDLVGSGEMEVIRSVGAGQPTLCLDIGANIGEYAIALLEHSPAKVIAFEPLPANIERLKLLEAKFPARLTVVEEGLAAKPGEVDLHHGPGECALASIYPEVSHIDYVAETFDRVTRIQITTLDDYFKRDGVEPPSQIDLVKVDCEGAEYDILKGGQETFATTPPKFVQIEFNRHHLFSGHSMRDIAGLFPDYSLWQLLPRGAGLVRRDPEDSLSNIYERSNWVFVRPGLNPPSARTLGS